MLESKQEDIRIYESPEIEQPKLKELWSYGLGSFGVYAISTWIGAFLTYYYTDNVGLAAATVGTLMLVARLFDGITDVGMGYIVDRTKSKYGKARPWLLWISVPFAVTTVLLFSVPDISYTGKLVYAYTTYFLFIIFITMIMIPYKTLMGVMTQHQHSRSLANIYTAIFTMVGNLIVMTLTQPLVSIIGWTNLSILYGVLSIITLFVTFRLVQERVGLQGEMSLTVPLKQGLSALFKNKYWWIITSYSVTFNATIALTQGAVLYYSQYILGDINYYPLVGLAISAPMLIGLFFVGPLVKRFGKRQVTMAGCLLFMLGGIIRMIDPTNLTTFLLGSAIGGFGAMPGLALTVAMVNDTVEYGEWQFKLRTEGLINSAASFGIKVGSGIGMGLIGWLLAFGGYIGGVAEQTPLANQMIMVLNLYIPVALVIIQLILLYFFKIDRIYPVILSDLQKRKSLK
ncbi:MFS transporter [Robertmurraya kyonggiensis]|uniref:MFS transporter n=1 Tax=Robertmurraya kyonggiensis TaxID=1037680 RepID=A0A4U1DAA7_9BACI|nr:MFS transporter [Robertmurraya kyonggiensis]TKC19078.1 MFS transporter [Robertmurraya kyonggiensis]